MLGVTGATVVTALFATGGIHTSDSRHGDVVQKSYRNNVVTGSSLIRSTPASADDAAELPGRFSRLVDLPTISNDTGVTALLCLGRVETIEWNADVSVHRLVTGTKRGGMAILDIDVSSSETIVTRTEVVQASKAQLPIFCLAVEDTTTLFAGGGDRYVSVWNQHSLPQHHSLQSWSQHPIQRLGPHTGWVKAVVLDSSSGDGSGVGRRLYSIGCNRIEVWAAKPNGDEKAYTDAEASNHQSETWVHEGSLVVQSGSRAEGACTLSSDILCLTMCHTRASHATDPTTISYIAAGGVDGRLHLFRRFATVGQTHDTSTAGGETIVAAHDGRINVVEFDAVSQLLLSASHDCTVRCWSLSTTSSTDTPTSSRLSIRQVASIHLDQNVRITALATWTTSVPSPTTKRTIRMLHVAAGTQNGSVYTLRLQECVAIVAADPSHQCLEFVQLQHFRIGRSDSDLESGILSSRPTIHAICPLALDALDVCTLAIGHSSGLSLLRR